MLYEMLTGRVPFSSTSEFAIMQGHVSAPPLPPREIAPGIPPDVEQVLLRALAKAPEQRFQTAEDFRAALLGQAPDMAFATQPLAPLPVTLPMPPQGDGQSSASPTSVTQAAPQPGPQMRDIKETRMSPADATPQMRDIQETRMAPADSTPQAIYTTPVGNPDMRPATWPTRTENEESHLRLYWKHYAAGGATALALLSIIAVGVMVGGVLKQSTSTPNPTVTPQPTIVMPLPITNIQATPDSAPQLEPDKLATPDIFAGPRASDEKSNAAKATRTVRRKTNAEAADRKEKERKAAEARKLLNQ
jgi:serine/threonine protein kinase